MSMTRRTGVQLCYIRTAAGKGQCGPSNWHHSVLRPSDQDIHTQRSTFKRSRPGKNTFQTVLCKHHVICPYMYSHRDGDATPIVSTFMDSDVWMLLDSIKGHLWRSVHTLDEIWEMGV